MPPIKLKSLIPNQEDVSKLTGQSLKMYISKHFPVAWKLHSSGKLSLYRGYDSDVNVKLIDPSTRIRKSKDSNNLSLFFMSSDPSWSGIQKRNRSVIFTNNEMTAEEYGDAYLVFPEDSAMISYGTASDNYMNFRAGLRKTGMDELVDGVEDLDVVLYRLAEAFPKQFPDNTTMRLIYDTGTGPMKFLAKIDKLYSKLSADDIDRLLNHGDISSRTASVATVIKKYGGVFPFLRTIYSPTLNKIKTAKLPALTRAPENVEMWTESRCLIVNQSTFNTDQ